VARPKSEDKRNAILDAATRVFAERVSTGCPPQRQRYQVRAGVADGTLFTYFKTKDDLINALYREIKLELADAMMSEFPRKKSVHARLRLYGRLCKLGVNNPEQRRSVGPIAGFRDAFRKSRSKRKRALRRNAEYDSRRH